MNIKYIIKGFIRLNISEKKYNDFLKKIKLDKYILLEENTKHKIVLEIQDKNTNKFKNTVCYIFYEIGKEINFKATEINFSKTIDRKIILENKKEIVNDILNKIDDIKYSISPEDYLDKTTFKYIQYI